MKQPSFSRFKRSNFLGVGGILYRIARSAIDENSVAGHPEALKEMDRQISLRHSVENKIRISAAENDARGRILPQQIDGGNQPFGGRIE